MNKLEEEGTLELTAPLALHWVVVDFGQSAPRPDHDLVQLRMPETANHTLERGIERGEKEKKIIWDKKRKYTVCRGKNTQ